VDCQLDEARGCGIIYSMNSIPETVYKKATQALNFFAQKQGGKINKMKAIKLIYFADRLHLRKYGRPIVGDEYWAMQRGPVGSITKNIAELSILPLDAHKYARKFLKVADEKKQTYSSIQSTDADVFSQTDLECLEAAYAVFSGYDQYELAEKTHDMPDWKKHEKELKAGKKRVLMDYKDFFADTKHDLDLFKQSASDLALARENFEEAKEVAAFFAT
jgi:uncharacterized phage-associated protein